MQILTKGEDPIPGSFLSVNIYADLENFSWWPLFAVSFSLQLCSKNVGQDLSAYLASSIVVEWSGRTIRYCPRLQIHEKIVEYSPVCCFGSIV